MNLANLLRRSGDTASARAHYETALRLDADHPQAHQGLGNLLAELGDLEGAEPHRRKGFQRQFITTLPAAELSRRSRYCFLYRPAAVTFRPLRFGIIESSSPRCAWRSSMTPASHFRLTI